MTTKMLLTLFLLIPLMTFETSFAKDEDKYLRITCERDNIHGSKDLLIIQQEDVSEYQALRILGQRYRRGEGIPFSLHFYRSVLELDQKLSRELAQEYYRSQKPDETLEMQGSFIANHFTWKTEKDGQDLVAGLITRPLNIFNLSVRTKDGQYIGGEGFHCNTVGNLPYSVELPVNKKDRFDFQEEALNYGQSESSVSSKY